MLFFTEPRLAPDNVEEGQQQPPSLQFWVDRGSADRTLKSGEFRTDSVENQHLVDPTAHVNGRDMALELEPAE